MRLYVVGKDWAPVDDGDGIEPESSLDAPLTREGKRALESIERIVERLRARSEEHARERR